MENEKIMHSTPTGTGVNGKALNMNTINSEKRIHRVEIIDEYKNQVCRYGNIMYCIECLENDPNQYKLCERETHLLCREDITDAIIS